MFSCRHFSNHVKQETFYLLKSRNTRYNNDEMLPLITFKTAAALVLSVGCNRGPITIAGLIVTMSIPFSFTNFQAASSAKVFESTYHSWRKLREHKKK